MEKYSREIMFVICVVMYVIGLYCTATGYDKNKPKSSTLRQAFCGMSTALWILFGFLYILY